MSTRLKGRRFCSVVADTNCLWEVVRSRGRGVFECEVVGDADFAGHLDVFTRKQIEAAIKWQACHEKDMREHEAFYASLSLGSIVHYCHNHRAYIRCEVVMARDRQEHDHPCVVEGERALRQIALVGEWGLLDLEPGSYHVTALGHLFKPHASSIWEHHKGPWGTADPRDMDVLAPRPDHPPRSW